MLSLLITTKLVHSIAALVHIRCYCSVQLQSQHGRYDRAIMHTNDFAAQPNLHQIIPSAREGHIHAPYISEKSNRSSCTFWCMGTNTGEEYVVCLLALLITSLFQLTLLTCLASEPCQYYAVR